MKIGIQPSDRPLAPARPSATQGFNLAKAAKLFAATSAAVVAGRWAQQAGQASNLRASPQGERQLTPINEIPSDGNYHIGFNQTYQFSGIDDKAELNLFLQELDAVEVNLINEGSTSTSIEINCDGEPSQGRCDTSDSFELKASVGETEKGLLFLKPGQLKLVLSNSGLLDGARGSVSVNRVPRLAAAKTMSEQRNPDPLVESLALQPGETIEGQKMKDAKCFDTYLCEPNTLTFSLSAEDRVIQQKGIRFSSTSDASAPNQLNSTLGNPDILELTEDGRYQNTFTFSEGQNQLCVVADKWKSVNFEFDLSASGDQSCDLQSFFNWQTPAPTIAPTGQPSASPSASPTNRPSQSPSNAPSQSPSAEPTATASASPSAGPSQSPSATPSQGPTASPSSRPSQSPSARPSQQPTPVASSSAPTAAPVTSSPTATGPTSLSPTTAEPDTAQPTKSPSVQPSTQQPATAPVASTASPVAQSTDQPTRSPAQGATFAPSSQSSPGTSSQQPSSTESTTGSENPSASPQSLETPAPTIKQSSQQKSSNSKKSNAGAYVGAGVGAIAVGAGLGYALGKLKKANAGNAQAPAGAPARGVAAERGGQSAAQDDLSIDMSALTDDKV